MTGETTFVKITNQDIYKKLVDVENRVIQTNGKVKFNRWAIGMLFTLLLAMGGVLANHLVSSVG